MVAAVASLFRERSRTQADEPVVDPRRESLIGRVRSLNPTASREFLIQFRPAALALYLDHLAAAFVEPRGGQGWTRPADTPAIVTRARHD